MSASTRGPVASTAPGAVRAAPAPSWASAFAGTRGLIWLAVRRDRILLPVWIIGFGLMVMFSVTATRDLYPDQGSMTSAAETVNATAALVALYGKIYAVNSLGAVSLIKLTAFGAAIVAMLFVFITVRHSRAEEESGRLELATGGVLGRGAPLTAALAVSIGAAVVLGVLCTAGLSLVGLPWAGSVAFGLSWTLTGIVFSAVAAVSAQVTVSARVATGLGMAAIGIAYVLRAVGDLAEGDPGWPSWLSPIGGSQQIRPFAGDRWWVTALPLLATLLLVPLAFALRSRRDLGSGMLAVRPGPASGRVDGLLGLAWRLQRGMLLAWVVGAALMGVMLGSVAENVLGLLQSEAMREFFIALGGQQRLVDAFLAAEIALAGAIISAYGVAAASRLHSEEDSGHAQLLLSAPTTRLRWAASHTLMALLGSAVVLLVAGVGIGVGHGVAIHNVGEETVRMLGAAAGHIPAAWVLVGLVLLAFGWFPLAVPAVWGVLVAFLVLGEFGQLWRLPQWVQELSPFAHSPTLPGGTVDTGQTTLVVLTALLLCVIGLVGWRRRDMTA